MCDCFNKLASSHSEMGDTKDVLYHILEVIAKHFTNEKPGLYFKVLDFACEAYENAALKQESAKEYRHRCEEVDRLIEYIVKVDHLHHHLEKTNYCRSPKLHGRVRRALFKDI